MYTLVIYDITDDDVRMRVACACREAGLVRIQRSAFIGAIDSQRRKNLAIRLKRILGSGKGNIQIFTICEPDMSTREVIGQGGDYEEEEGVVFL